MRANLPSMKPSLSATQTGNKMSAHFALLQHPKIDSFLSLTLSVCECVSVCVCVAVC